MIRPTTMTAKRCSWDKMDAGMVEDIINMVCKQPATARFLARHMYNFFVADEVQVPSWRLTPPKDIPGHSRPGKSLF